MTAQSVAVTRYSRAPVGMRRAPARSTPPLRRPVTALTAVISQHGIIFGLKLAAGALAAATATLAILNNQDSFQAATTFEPAAQNETIVYRQASVQHVHHHDHADDVDAADEHEEPAAPAAAPSYYTRVVQTIRFLNPVAAARETVQQGAIKVGGFMAFPARKESTDTDVELKSRRRGTSIMDEVDDYLWEVYQRVPVKKDGAGDFTWKDPAAAKRVGMTLQDYVIGGMDPEFREQLYHAGKAMDAAGIQWSLLSAFRDDYRQGIATGFKARGGNSLHGGSRRTGGYGHGRAVDVTGADGQMSEVWSWIDAHGAKYALYRPMPGNDPAHVQQRGDWHKIALALRETRTRVADAAAVRGKDKTKVVANAK